MTRLHGMIPQNNVEEGGWVPEAEDQPIVLGSDNAYQAEACLRRPEKLELPQAFQSGVDLCMYALMVIIVLVQRLYGDSKACTVLLTESLYPSREVASAMACRTALQKVSPSVASFYFSYGHQRSDDTPYHVEQPKHFVNRCEEPSGKR
jgi:hypothetical protein